MELTGHKGPLIRRFGILFVISLDKLLDKQSNYSCDPTDGLFAGYKSST